MKGFATLSQFTVATLYRPLQSKTHIGEVLPDSSKKTVIKWYRTKYHIVS